MDEKLRILLCEDDENLGMLLREFLQTKGYYADLYPDGDAGYKAFLKGKYDLCMLDVMMPRKDGFTLAKELRSVNAEISSANSPSTLRNRCSLPTTKLPHSPPRRANCYRCFALIATRFWNATTR